jgi:hypothetical protein
MARALALMLLLLGAGTAWAQPAPAPGEPETVYSDARRLRDEQLSRRFVQSLLRPSASLEGQFSRWKDPICLNTYGLRPTAAYVIEQRIRKVADLVGAPVERTSPCTPNIGIIVTPDPQASLDSIAATRAFLLQGGNQKPVAIYPVQAWYTAFRTEYDGFRVLDIPREDAESWRDYIPQVSNDLPWSKANLSRLHTGQTTEIAAATVLVDVDAINGMTLGSLADYLALLVLAQTPATGRCQPAPSIANLFLKDCEADFHTAALSDVDLAMLTALYQTPDEPEKLQATRLIGNMRRNLEGESRK